MKHLKAVTIAATVIVGTLASPARANSDAIENIAAIAAAQNVCGYAANSQMVEIAIRTLVGDPSQVQEGGRYWPEMQADFARIIRLTSTEAGQQSFCARVKRDLSAFFD